MATTTRCIASGASSLRRLGSSLPAGSVLHESVRPFRRVDGFGRRVASGCAARERKAAHCARHEYGYDRRGAPPRGEQHEDGERSQRGGAP
jgi:hypothetical protein